ncbi:MAG TPA: tetratricopeptide repeat protein [Verrucomicrobiales bacterium]|jgi:TolA-binding protein|nr:tetratricopeptide repeat protein [Verrucomicrobiales bacterium]
MSKSAPSPAAGKSASRPLICGLVGLLCCAAPVAAQKPPKAVPVDEETDPGPAPAPKIPKAIPVPDSPPEPAAPPAAETPRPAPRTNSARTADDDLFDYCELLFSKANYPLALQQYNEYFNTYPNGKHREDVVFKMGECQYLSESWDAAILQYDLYLHDYGTGKNRAVVLYHAGEAHYKMASKVSPDRQPERIRLAYEAYRASIQTAKSGPYACYSAFRLGSFSYNAAQRDPERYKESVRWFTIAASQAPKSQPRIRVTSLFYLGRSQRFLKANKDAAATFTELTKIKEENIYFDQAWQELAQMDMEAGHTEEAMKKFERLSKESVDAETRANSLVNSGMILADGGKAAEAIARFEEALKVPGDKSRSARARARFGLVWSSYKEKDYKRVTDAWKGIQGEDYGDLDEFTRARLWLIVGGSYAALDMHSPAAQTLRLLENLNNSPDRQVREACLEGGYKRIVSLFKLGDPGTPDAVDDFVRAWQDRTPENAYLDKAYLVKGAWYFNRNSWDVAARAYKMVREAKLEKEKVSTWLYQRGCAEASSGDREAVSTLTSFLNKNPDDERAPMAQLQRGLVRLKVNDLSSALTDFEQVAQKAAGTENGETAAYNAARVKGIKQDFPGMIAAFTKFLADYPKTKASAEANYWVGTGNYQIQKYKECLVPLRTARTLDSSAYYQDASLMLIAALTALKDVDALIPEVDAYLKSGMSKRISPDILRWLGVTLFRERKDCDKTARYLGFVVTFAEPEKTAPEIWAIHGESLLEKKDKDYAGAIAALDNELKAEQRPPQRARAFLLRGRAQYYLGRYDDASKSVEEGLSIDRETLVAAQLHLLSGDIAAAGNRHKEALSSYNNVRVTWEDPILTPTAIFKMCAILIKSTDAKEKADGEAMKKELSQRYPKFTAPK